MDKKLLQEILKEEREIYLSNTEKTMKRKCHKRYEIWRYLYYFRKCQFYYERRVVEERFVKKKVAKILHKIYDRKRNVAGSKAGVEIGMACKVGRRLDIWHGGVIINGNIGDNCTLHGNNVIGNKGKGKEMLVPTIGNNVDVGAGAVIIGDVVIADNCVIGANATVVKSVEEESSIIIGNAATVYK